MTNETDENREPQSRSLSAMTVVIWLVGLLPAAYVLSIGPVVAVWQKLSMADAPLRLFYAPIIALMESNRSGWFTRGVEWWLNLWGVQ